MGAKATKLGSWDKILKNYSKYQTNWKRKNVKNNENREMSVNYTLVTAKRVMLCVLLSNYQRERVIS